jgi:hypothetical protein
MQRGDDYLSRWCRWPTANCFKVLILAGGLFAVAAAVAEPTALDIRDVHLGRHRRTGAVIVSVRLVENPGV